ncbi:MULTISPECIES: LysM peptidoglycan-binding domain-containing protein [Paenibacillus]|uniref:LysM peptidoglycan-binding domain-containing protein n=1 Tax=Paenibacillus radicis (ex Xue et al. 2023) TaxID=2972489 RepID=A0ABT1YKR4_9BACL|nr:LysM peptidoglycan-binding domain-containing protein [Paenibacillus radicis (ex Xue et al. 2023)]MCR8633774.1 LysM peptidoglycan-binding domain-containing protein [Paenibacillus radicis (ex Xue et al. 2023)]
MALKKAQIIVDKGNSKETISVLFNPNEYSLDTSNSYSWDSVPGLSMPIGQFVSGGTTSLTMDIFFDTYEKGTDVRAYTKKISGLLDVEKDLHAPPVCRFVWGSLDFKGVVEKVNQRFTMFLDSGIPVRATLKVTFRSWQSKKEQLQNIPRQSADRTKQKLLKQGEQLWMVAAHEYENPGLWREIANANGIDNPLKLQSGRRITVPRLE